MGMIGGGTGALIAPVHRIAANAGGLIELVSGSFSNVRIKSKESGSALGLDPKRVYGIYRDMFRRESKLPAAERIDFISIVTPSNMHYPVTMAALDAGFHVICEAPMTTTVDEAQNLARKMELNDKIFCLSQHHYGYPMVLEARKMVQDGKLGKIRKVVVEYPQAWLSTRIEAKGQKQASWRTNPRSTAASCCMSDVASIAYDLAATITGLQASEVSADTSTFVNGRMLDDDGSILLRYEDGARGLIWATQVAIGEQQALKIRVYGENGSLRWKQSEPHTLKFWSLDGNTEIKSSEPLDIKEEAAHADDIPPGHPDSSIEPLINIYKNFSETLIKIIDGEKVNPSNILFPGIPEGIQSAKFTEAALANAASDDKWTTIS